MSVTFRNHPAADVVKFTANAGLKKISWSGDVHVQPGNILQAHEAKKMCSDSGLGVEGYGSYWRADDSPFDAVVDTAAQLGAPRIRVWAGTSGSLQADGLQRRSTAAAIAAAADLAASADIELHLEFHRNTLTDTAASTLDLLAAIAALRESPACPVRSYWQPRPGIDDATALAELDSLAGHVDALHVFSWDAESTRLPLSIHRSAWLERLRRLSAPGGPDLDLMLEFVAGESEQQLILDSRELHDWLAGLNAHGSES